MAISAIANSGIEPPTLANLLQINRINPITGRDSDDAVGISGASAPKAGAKQSVIPKLVQDVLKTLSEMGANLAGDQSKIGSANSANSQELKKSALDFLSSVISSVKTQTEGTASKTVSPLEQLNAGVTKMISEVNGGTPLEVAVAQSADKLLKTSGLAANANTLSGLLEGLQKSLLDGSSSGSLVNITA